MFAATLGSGRVRTPSPPFRRFVKIRATQSRAGRTVRPPPTSPRQRSRLTSRKVCVVLSLRFTIGGMTRRPVQCTGTVKVMASAGSAAKDFARVAAAAGSGVALECACDSHPTRRPQSRVIPRSIRSLSSVVCPYTKKKFRSRATYESYLRSKKYLQLAADAERQRGSDSLRQDGGEAAASIGGDLQSIGSMQQSSASATAATSTRGRPVDQHDAGVATGARSATAGGIEGVAAAEALEALEATEARKAAETVQAINAVRRSEAVLHPSSIPPSIRPPPRRSEAAEDGWSSEEEDGWVDEDEPWIARWTESLFDTHESPTFEANVVYMRRVHSFSVPYREHLENTRGLFAHLQEKVMRRCACLYCHRLFASAEACRSHMRDKAHCRIDCETIAGAIELVPFYAADWHSAMGGAGSSQRAAGGASARRRGRSAHPASTASTSGAVAGAADAYELVLADGTRVGHRSMAAYYRQRFRPQDDRTAVQASLHNLAAARHRQRVLEAKLALRGAARRQYKLLLAGAASSRGGHSKALAAQFTFKASFADDKHARALTHHGYGGFGGGAHYTMAGSKQFQRGVRIKGVVSRHSRQAAKRNGMRMRQQGDGGGR